MMWPVIRFLLAMLAMALADVIFFTAPYLMTRAAHGADDANAMLLLAALPLNLLAAISFAGMAYADWRYEKRRGHA